MAICSSITAWKIPWTEEPGWLQSLRSPSVGLDRVTERTLTLTHMHSFHHRLLQDIEYSSLCYTVGPYWLFILYIAVCMCYITKVCLVKAIVFLVVICGCESWTIKKPELWRVDAFELWCWRRLLRAPWTARRSNQSILKEISSEYSLEGLMLKLKLQYIAHLMWRTDSLE